MDKFLVKKIEIEDKIFTLYKKYYAPSYRPSFEIVVSNKNFLKDFFTQYNIRPNLQNLEFNDWDDPKKLTDSAIEALDKEVDEYRKYKQIIREEKNTFLKEVR